MYNFMHISFNGHLGESIRAPVAPKLWRYCRIKECDKRCEMKDGLHVVILLQYYVSILLSYTIIIIIKYVLIVLWTY